MRRTLQGRFSLSGGVETLRWANVLLGGDLSKNAGKSARKTVSDGMCGESADAPVQKPLWRRKISILQNLPASLCGANEFWRSVHGGEKHCLPICAGRRTRSSACVPRRAACAAIECAEPGHGRGKTDSRHRFASANCGIPLPPPGRSPRRSSERAPGG